MIFNTSKKNKIQQSTYLRKCLDKKSAYSAQRLAGLTGWFFVIVFLMVSMIFVIELPNFFELFMIISAALLGLDSLAEIVAAWKGNVNLNIGDLENPFTGDTIEDMVNNVEDKLEKLIKNDMSKADILTNGHHAYLNPMKIENSK